MRSLVVSSLLLSSFLLVPRAGAQYEEWESVEDERTLDEEAEAYGVELEPAGDGHRGLVYSDFLFFHDQDNSGLSFLFGLEYATSDAFRFEILYGVSGAILALPGDKERQFSSGNPFLAGYYVHELGEWPNEMKLVMGAGLAMPAAGTNLTTDGVAPPDAPSEVVAAGYFYALTARGLRDSWLFAPDTTTPVLTFAFESHLSDLILDTGVDVGVMVPVRDRDSDVETIVQWQMKLGYRPIEELEFGFGASAVITTGEITPGSGDHCQGSWDLYLLGRVGGVLLGLDFLVNAGEPFGEGLLSRGESIWGLTTTLGIELP